ncbi:MAG: TolC family protein [Alphaproteobacteria bacterium]|nr:TolC family protein [Alphaproteobacteria bacterium]
MRPFGRLRLSPAVLLVCAGLSACATYHALPLSTAPTLLPAPKDALDMRQAARFALIHSPDLTVARAQAELAMARADESAHLPDPQFQAMGAPPTVHMLGLTDAYSLGLAQDLQGLLTEPARAEGARAKADQARLELAWRAVQTTQTAATLYAQAVLSTQKERALAKLAAITRTEAAHSAAALRQHNTTIANAGSDLSASLDILSQRDAAARAALVARAGLKAVLGIEPNARLRLKHLADPPPISRAAVIRALAKVRDLRPDLLALRAGYHAQNEAVITALLEQFPAMNVGFQRASDNTNVQTNGLTVTVNIPIFGSTQARIRTARANRAQLHAEYQARLDLTASDAWRTWHALVLLHRQVGTLEQAVPVLRRMAARARAAYAEGNLSPASYVLLETSLASREGELADLKQTLWQDTIALRTVLGLPPLGADADKKS